MPHLQMKVTLVIAGEQAHAGVSDWMAIHAIENAYGDRVVVDDRKVLIGATNLSRAKKKRRRQAKGERQDSETRDSEREKSNSRAEGRMRRFACLSIVVNPRHACSVRACDRPGAWKVERRSCSCRLRKKRQGMDRDGKHDVG